MSQKWFFSGVVVLLFLAFPAYSGQGENGFLLVRILEKQKLQELEVQSPEDKGTWNQIKLTRGHLSVNSKAQKEASWGSPDSIVKIRAFNLTRSYPGTILITAQAGEKGPELLILNQVFIGDYTACVTAFESGFDSSQPEYLKALAVIIRAYASSHRRRHDSYDLCDLSHCQVYQGLPNHFSFWKRMADAGASFSFPPAWDLKSIYFHRCCGGVLESSDQLWGGEPSPSRTEPDEWEGRILCQDDPLFHWTSSTDVKNVETILRSMARLPSGAILRILRVGEKTNHGRNKILSARFQLPDGEIKEIRENAVHFESEFGKQYGWRVFPSDLFEIKREGDTFHFSGRGLGHGVGLCQSGALKLAQMGWSWEKILDFYFPPR